MPLEPARTSHFRASYDRTTKIVSAVVCIVLAIAVLSVPNLFAKVLGVLIIALSYGYSPRGYVCSGQAIVVRRILGNATVPLRGLREARAAIPEDLRGLIRLWGNGGLFGYYGIFRTSRLGRCQWYVTDRSKIAIVIAGSRTTLFSPDRLEAFLAEIRGSLPIGGFPASQLQGETWGADRAHPNPTFDDAWAEGASAWTKTRRFGIALGAVAAIAAISLILLAITYAPGAPAYTLTADALTIHDRFYPVTLPASAVDAEHIRVVDAGQETNWRPIARTNGFANAHYHSGWFRVAGGQTVRMYWTNSQRMVLLPPQAGGPPVLLEVREPEKFVNEVRRLWTKSSPSPPSILRP